MIRIKKLTYEEVKNYIESYEGYKLLSTEYINSKQKLTLSCPKNHIYKVKYDNFKTGKRCPDCSKNKKLTFEYVKNYIESFNYKLLSYEYINNYNKLKMKCPKGHIINMKFSNFKTGYRCSFCNLENKSPYINTDEYIINYFNKTDYTLCNIVRKNSKIEIILKDIYGYYYRTLFNRFIRNSLPDKFNKSNPYTIQNIILWIKLNNKPFELISEKYNGANETLKWKCLKEGCNDTFEMSWDSIYTGHNCSVCAGMQIGKSNCLAIKNPELVSEWHIVKNNNLTPYDITCGSNKKVWWKCSKCNCEWDASPNTRNHGTGCPQCNESKGEKTIRKWLEFNNIIFNHQKTFPGLIGLGNGNLSYDFYLPNYNLLIEYQGEQHEKPVDFEGKGIKHAKKRLKIQLEHDYRKRQYANTVNINLLEIWYYDFNKIEDILNKYLL